MNLRSSEEGSEFWTRPAHAQISPSASSIRLSSGPVVSAPVRAPSSLATMPEPTKGDPNETVPTMGGTPSTD